MIWGGTHSSGSWRASLELPFHLFIQKMFIVSVPRTRYCSRHWEDIREVKKKCLPSLTLHFNWGRKWWRSKCVACHYWSLQWRISKVEKGDREWWVSGEQKHGPSMEEQWERKSRNMHKILLLMSLGCLSSPCCCNKWRGLETPSP